MTSAREIRTYDYVNRPYRTVADAMRTHALEVFREATASASTRARDVAASLRVQIAGVEVAKDIAISIETTEEGHSSSLSTTILRQELVWRAATSPHLFPLMRAEIRTYALSATETQLELLGHYEPPLGVVGKGLDRIAGYRIAEATVHRFLADVAAHLRRTLP